MKKITPSNVVVDTTDDVTDYIKSGALYRNSVMRNVMVESESDLTNLTQYEIGTIAYTAGLKKVWQKDANGDWVELA